MFTLGFGITCFAIGGLWALRREGFFRRDVTRLEQEDSTDHVVEVSEWEEQRRDGETVEVN